MAERSLRSEPDFENGVRTPAMITAFIHPPRETGD
jgi:hypothetical protein